MAIHLSHSDQEPRGRLDGNNPGRREAASASRSTEQSSFTNKIEAQQRGQYEPPSYADTNRGKDIQRPLALLTQTLHFPGEGFSVTPRIENSPENRPFQDGTMSEAERVIIHAMPGSGPLLSPSPGSSTSPNHIHVASDEDASSGKVHDSNLKLSTLQQLQPEPSKMLSATPKNDATDPDSDQAFKSEWAHIKKCENDNMGLQSQIHEMRRSLREKQAAKAILEDRLFRRVRLKEMGIIAQEDDATAEGSILDLIDKLQEARDEYGPLEDDCNRLEDQLKTDEFEVRRLHSVFFSKWKFIPYQISPSTLDNKEDTTESEGDEEEVEDENHHPLVIRYLSKLGDFDLVQERLDDVLDEIEQLEEQRETRKSLGLGLGSEEQEWLDDSQRLENEVREEYRVLEAEVEELRKRCLSQNLIDADGEPKKLIDQEQEIFEDDDLVSGTEISEYSKYPILLPKRAGIRQEDSSEYDDISPAERSDSVGGRVNTWILNRVRSSPLEAELLARTYRDQEKGGKTSEQWQKMALELWFDDGTTSTAEVHVYTTSMGTRAHLGSDISSSSSDILGMKVSNPQIMAFRSPLSSRSGVSNSTEIAIPIL